jgi:hypothetical protein
MGEQAKLTIAALIMLFVVGLFLFLMWRTFS